jgi:hypothetical protein
LPFAFQLFQLSLAESFWNSFGTRKRAKTRVDSGIDVNDFGMNSGASLPVVLDRCTIAS